VNRPTAALVVVLLFVSGLVIGVMGTHLYYFYHLRGPRGGPPGPGAGFIVGAMERDLGLSPEQAREVRAIIERARQRGFELRRDTLPRMHEIMEATTRDIRAVLTPEQRERFDALSARRGRWLESTMLGTGGHRRHGGFEERRPGPPGMPGPHHGPPPGEPDPPPSDPPARP